MGRVWGGGGRVGVGVGDRGRVKWCGAGWGAVRWVRG